MDGFGVGVARIGPLFDSYELIRSTGQRRIIG
jgi:hypothetical protein